MHYSEISNSRIGFTNQVFVLITSIIIALRNNEKVVVFGEFLNDINKTKYTPIKDIFNINKINIFLKNTYNLIIVDRNNINFNITSVKYGIDEKNNIDITKEFINKFYSNNVLHVDKNYCFNDLKIDPYYGIRKKLFLQYKINDDIIDEIYDENLKNDIIINFKSNYSFSFGWINYYDTDMFEKILLNLTYTDDFTSKADSFKKTLNFNVKINIIHLRLEEDAINYWSKKNNMICNDYKLYIENKYINIIKKYTLQSEDNIILCSDLSNGVIDFMKNNNYSYKFIPKFFEDREKNAIVEFLVSNCCNNIFIGNFNIKNLNGSSCSYYVGKSMKNDVMKIYIDLDKIYNKEEIVYKY